MILTGKEIKNKIKSGDIIIDPYDEKRLNSNSYNLRLDNKILIYNKTQIDMKENNITTEIIIPENGYILHPGTLYLAKTKEYTETYNLVPMVNGRSSMGRLGVFIHITAGFGDTGFCGQWTLELAVIQPVKIYPFVEVAQIYYNTIQGEVTEYTGKYQKAKEIQSCRLYTEFNT